MDYPTFTEIEQLYNAEIHRLTNGTEALDKRRPLLPLYRDILADMETPVSAYCKTAQQPYSFLLESVTGGEHVKRYSFIGIDPYLVLIQRNDIATLLHMRYEQHQISPQTTREDIPCFDPLKLVEMELGHYRLVTSVHTTQDHLPTFHGGAVGYLAYDAAARFERLPVPPPNELNLPLAVFTFTETVLVFDHVKHRVRAV